MTREDLRSYARSSEPPFTVAGAEAARRIAFLQLDADDIACLRRHGELARAYVDPLIEDFYRHLLSFAEVRAYFQDPQVLDRVKEAQKSYFLQLTSGDFGPSYVAERIRVGVAHEHIGLPAHLFLGMECWYLRRVCETLRANVPDQAEAQATMQALLKIMFFDMGLVMDTYIALRERTIKHQQEAIRELSTPVLKVRSGLLILPIIGELDADRARQLTEQLLRGVRAHRARAVVMDITGVLTVDTNVANRLVQTVEAARLMGAAVILTGMSPEIARAVVTLGINLDTLTTVGDLQSGIEIAEGLLARLESAQPIDQRSVEPLPWQSRSSSTAPS